jgi:hypothetical protein
MKTCTGAIHESFSSAEKVVKLGQIENLKVGEYAENSDPRYPTASLIGTCALCHRLLTLLRTTDAIDHGAVDPFDRRDDLVGELRLGRRAATQFVDFGLDLGQGADRQA